MANGIYGALGSVKSNIKARRQLQPDPDMGKNVGKRKSGADSSYGISNMGASNKKKTGRYKGLA